MLWQALSPEWSMPLKSMINMINMGLYTDVDVKLAHHTRSWILQVLSQIYMFVVQILLLNMLIALMAESNDRVRAISKLVAQYERAKLILHWERRLSHISDSRSASIWRLLAGLPSGIGQHSFERIFPRWLHVLLPAGSDGGSEGPRDVQEQVHAPLIARMAPLIALMASSPP